MNPSGGFQLSSNLNFAIPAGGNALSAYNVPIQPNHQTSYSAGTGPNQITKGAQQGGSAAAAPVTIDLTAIACVDGSVGFTHVREVAIYNDSTVAGQVLKLDLTVASSFLGPAEAGVKLDIAPGAVQRFSRPLDTNGWAVASGTKLVTLDPVAATIPYRLVVAGD